jgi:hypothetical protein
MFDIPSSGLNSFDCARKAPLFDVLVHASEDKEYKESEALDYNEIK